MNSTWPIRYRGPSSTSNRTTTSPRAATSRADTRASAWPRCWYATRSRPAAAAIAAASSGWSRSSPSRASSAAASIVRCPANRNRIRGPAATPTATRARSPSNETAGRVDAGPRWPRSRSAARSRATSAPSAASSNTSPGRVRSAPLAPAAGPGSPASSNDATRVGAPGVTRISTVSRSATPTSICGASPACPAEQLPDPLRCRREPAADQVLAGREPGGADELAVRDRGRRARSGGRGPRARAAARRTRPSPRGVRRRADAARITTFPNRASWWSACTVRRSARRESGSPTRSGTSARERRGVLAGRHAQLDLADLADRRARRRARGRSTRGAAPGAPRPARRRAPEARPRARRRRGAGSIRPLPPQLQIDAVVAAGRDVRVVVLPLVLDRRAPPEPELGLRALPARPGERRLPAEPQPVVDELRLELGARLDDPLPSLYALVIRTVKSRNGPSRGMNRLTCSSSPDTLKSACAAAAVADAARGPPGARVARREAEREERDEVLLRERRAARELQHGGRRTGRGGA